MIPPNHLPSLLTGVLLPTWIMIAASAPPIDLDGRFDDWDGIAPLATDSTGDAAPGRVDFGAVTVTDRDGMLFFRLELGRETILQNPSDADAGNDIWLYLDTRPNQGVPVEELEVELQLGLGAKTAHAHIGRQQGKPATNAVGLASAPTHSATEFELRLPYRKPDHFLPALDTPLLADDHDTVRFFLREGADGDRLPDSGYLEYTLTRTNCAPPIPIELQRNHAGEIRVLVHNVERDAPAKKPEPFLRYLRALQPDIVNFQEMYTMTAQDARALVAEALGDDPTAPWQAVKVNDCATVSRWPILAHADITGNLVCRIDLPDDRTAHDLVVFNVHTPCCAKNIERDFEHDALSATWRDLLASRGPFPAAATDAMIMVGDFNMVGYVRQLHTLRDGRLIDNDRFGPDFAPGRARGSLAVAPLRHTHTRQYYTWRKDTSEFTPGKLDYIFYTDDTIALERDFTVFTPDIPLATLEQLGMRLSDSVLASDHLILVADIHVAPLY